MRTYLMTGLAAMATFALLLVSADAQNTGNAPTDKKPGTGEKLFYDNQCYACHGYSGQNGPGKRLVPMKMAQVAFTAYVRAPGGRGMPSYSAKVLSDAQLGDIWAYIKTLPDSPAAKDIPLIQQIKGEVSK
jgi:mono/diheme cytochrome c family protein